MPKISRISRLVLILASYLLSLSTFATTKGEVSTSILFNCSVSFYATGKSAYLGIGFTDVNGTGMMTCLDYVKNVVEEIPLKVKIRGPGAGLGITGLSISGGQVGIGLNESPDALLGKYVLARGNAAVGVGASLGTGLRVSKGAFDLIVNIQATNGLGAGIDLLTVELERDAARQVHVTAVPTPPAPPVIKVPLGQVVEVVDANGKVVKRYKFIQ